MQTEHVDGWVVDRGPDAFLVQKPAAIALCTELGLESQLVSTLEPRTAFVLREGRLHPLPEGSFLGFPVSLRGLAASSLFTPLGKARMAAEALVPARDWDDGDDESIAAFVGRRFGARGGGLPGGAAPGRHPRGRRGHAVGAPAVSPSGGHRAPAREPAASLPRDEADAVSARGVRLSDRRRGGAREGARVSPAGEHASAGLPRAPRPARRGVGWLCRRHDGRLEVRSRRGDGRAVLRSRDARARISTSRCPRNAAPSATRPPPRWRSATARVRWPIPCAARASWCRAPRGESARGHMGHIEVARTRAARPRAAPRLFRRGPRPPAARPTRRRRADPPGGRRARGRCSASPATRSQTWVSRWTRQSPQYVVGHGARIRAIESRLSRHPGLFAAGSGFGAIGIPDCIAHGRATATRIHEWLSAAPNSGSGLRAPGSRPR